MKNLFLAYLLFLTGCSEQKENSVKIQQKSIVEMSQMEMQHHLESLGYEYIGPAWKGSTSIENGIRMGKLGGFSLSCHYQDGRLIDLHAIGQINSERSPLSMIKHLGKIENSLGKLAEYSYDHAPNLGIVNNNPIKYQNGLVFLVYDYHKARLCMPQLVD